MYKIIIDTKESSTTVEDANFVSIERSFVVVSHPRGRDMYKLASVTKITELKL